MLKIITAVAALTLASVGAMATPLSKDICLAQEGWMWDTTTNVCAKDNTYWAKHPVKTCRAQLVRHWGQNKRIGPCSADDPHVPALAQNEPFRLVDTVSHPGHTAVGELTVVCQRGVLKMSRVMPATCGAPTALANSK